MASATYASTSVAAPKPTTAKSAVPEMDAQPETAESIYQRLDADRHLFLTRARTCSELTIPGLIPPEGANSTTVYPTPWQSTGAEGVNNLASKLLLALFPPNSPFFRLVIDEFALKEAAGSVANTNAVAQLKTQMEKALGTVENQVMSEIETCAMRVGAFEALKHLVVAGNALVYIPSDKGGLRVFHLANYVVERDSEGHPLTIITRERVSPSMLPDTIRVQAVDKHCKETNKDRKAIRELDLYTLITRKSSGMWSSVQECKGITIDTTRGVFTDENLPYIPLRFHRIDGEHYGRGFVEEYIGDLKALDGLSRCIVQGSAMAAKVIFMVNPNGTTKVTDISNAKNGDVIQGLKDDVHVFQMEKYADFRVASETALRIEQRLMTAFIMNRSVQRDAERVTAEEIRLMAQELESTLGGVYSILSQELQLPVVNVLITRLQKQKRCPKLPKSLVRPAIVTGVEALGRGNDLTKLDQFVAGAQQTIGPDAVRQYINIPEYFKRRATALGIEDEGLVKTAEEIAQEQQQAQMSQLASTLGPNAVKAVGDNINQAQQHGHESAMAQMAMAAQSQKQ